MNRLRELREDKDLLQKDIANVLRVSQRVYGYIEIGQTALTQEILEKLADFYNVSVDYLLYRTDERKPYPKSFIEKK